MRQWPDLDWGVHFHFLDGEGDQLVQDVGHLLTLGLVVVGLTLALLTKPRQVGKPQRHVLQTQVFKLDGGLRERFKSINFLKLIHTYQARKLETFCCIKYDVYIVKHEKVILPGQILEYTPPRILGWALARSWLTFLTHSWWILCCLRECTPRWFPAGVPRSWGRMLRWGRKVDCTQPFGGEGRWTQGWGGPCWGGYQERLWAGSSGELNWRS